MWDLAADAPSFVGQAARMSVFSCETKCLHCTFKGSQSGLGNVDMEKLEKNNNNTSKEQIYTCPV